MIHRPGLVVAIVVAFLYVVVVLPGTGILIVRRQIIEHDQVVHAACVERQEDRDTLLRLIDFATKPSDIDPNRIESSELRNSVLIQNARADSFNQYAHGQLPPIVCGG